MPTSKKRGGQYLVGTPRRQMKRLEAFPAGDYRDLLDLHSGRTGVKLGTRLRVFLRTNSRVHRAK
jgi:hypothetical protein